MNSEYAFSSRYLNQGYSSKAFQSGENDPYLVVCIQNVPTNKPGSEERNEYLSLKAGNIQHVELNIKTLLTIIAGVHGPMN